MKTLVLILSFIVCLLAFFGMLDSALHFGYFGALALLVTCLSAPVMIYHELFFVAD